MDALSKVIDTKIAAGCSTSFNPVEHIADERDSKAMKSLSEVGEMKTSQHALSEEMQDQKLKKKSLMKHQHKEIDKRQRGLYLFSASIVKKIRREKGIAFVRFFADGPGPLMMAKQDHPQDEFNPILMNLINANYNGGGTNLLAAIKAAVKDISAADAKEPLAKVTILMITDMGDNFNEAALRNALGKYELSVLDVSGTNNAYDAKNETHLAFKAVATKFYKVNQQQVDLDKIIQLL